MLFLFFSFPCCQYALVWFYAFFPSLRSSGPCLVFLSSRTSNLFICLYYLWHQELFESRNNSRTLFIMRACVFSFPTHGIATKRFTSNLFSLVMTTASSPCSPVLQMCLQSYCFEYCVLLLCSFVFLRWLIGYLLYVHIHLYFIRNIKKYKGNVVNRWEKIHIYKNIKIT